MSLHRTACDKLSLTIFVVIALKHFFKCIKKIVQIFILFNSPVLNDLIMIAVMNGKDSF